MIQQAVSQVAFEVITNDVTVSFAAEAGHVRLNAIEPIISHALSESVTHLEMARRTLAERCIRGITANVDRLRVQVEASIGIATALNPNVGYAQTTAVAQGGAEKGVMIQEVVMSHGLLGAEDFDVILNPQALTGVRSPHDSSDA